MDNFSIKCQLWKYYCYKTCHINRLNLGLRGENISQKLGVMGWVGGEYQSKNLG